MPVLAFRTNSKPDKSHDSSHILNVDVGELSRLEIVDSFSPASHSSVVSPYSSSSKSSISPQSKMSTYSLSDNTIEHCCVNLAKIQLHFKPVKKRRSSFRRSKRGKSIHKTGVAESAKAPLNFILKSLPEPAQLTEYSKTIMTMRARRFSRADYDNIGLDELASFAAHQRRITDAVWRKAGELLQREILFHKLLATATAKNRSKLKLSFMPDVFFELCENGHDKVSTMTSDYIFMRDIGEDAKKGDAIVGLSKEQVDACINAISEFHAFSTVLMDKKMVEFLTIEEPEKRKESLVKEWLGLKLLKLPNTMLMNKDAEIHEFVLSTNFYQIGIYKKFGIPPVLCHGDLHAGNVFFDKKSGALRNILDWKLAYPSTGLNDLARLLLTSVNSSLRIKHMDEWLALYTANFNNTLKRLGHKKGFYGNDLVRRMFQAEYASQLLYAIIFLVHMYERVGDEPNEKNDSTNEDGLRIGIIGRIVHGFESMERPGHKSK